MPIKDKGVVKRVIVTPDKHFPFADKKAIGCVVKAIEIVKPDTYVDLGDVGESHGASHWRWKKKKRPPLEYIIDDIDKDIEDVNKGLDIIDEALDKVNCKNKHMIEGNHDDWMNRFVDEHPYLEDMRFETCVNLKERNYTYHPIGKYLLLGKLYLYHGHHFAGVQHTRNHLMRLGCNLMYGHHHDIQQSSITHIDGQKSAWSLGCLKDMSPQKNNWLGGRQHNWSHAFAIVDFYDKGLFTVHLIQIINGKTSLWGEVIRG